MKVRILYLAVVVFVLLGCSLSAPEQVVSDLPTGAAGLRATLEGASPEALATAAAASEYLATTVAATVEVLAAPPPTPQPTATYEPIPPIILTLDADMFPPEWHQDPIKISATPLSEAEWDRTRAMVLKAMQRYPAHLLNENLAQVYAVGSLEFYGINASGTNSLDTVYIANGGEGLGYTDVFVESTFYHEFSSILLRNFPENFSESDWRAANPEWFSYGSGGVDAIKRGQASEDFNYELYELGFLNEYGMASMEEDFNEYSENLFTGNPAFWNAVDHYPTVRQKTSLAIEFYNSLDPVFTEAFFRGE